MFYLQRRMPRSCEPRKPFSGLQCCVTTAAAARVCTIQSFCSTPWLNNNINSNERFSTMILMLKAVHVYDTWMRSGTRFQSYTSMTNQLIRVNVVGYIITENEK